MPSGLRGSIRAAWRRVTSLFTRRPQPTRVNYYFLSRCCWRNHGRLARLENSQLWAYLRRYGCKSADYILGIELRGRNNASLQVTPGYLLYGTKRIADCRCVLSMYLVVQEKSGGKPLAVLEMTFAEFLVAGKYQKSQMLVKWRQDRLTGAPLEVDVRQLPREGDAFISEVVLRDRESENIVVTFELVLAIVPTRCFWILLYSYSCCLLNVIIDKINIL